MDAFEAVSLPESSSPAHRRFFSPAEANRSLVLVRRITDDIVKGYRELRELHDSLQSHESQGEWPGSEKARERYAAITDHLSELREEIEGIGCELKDYEIGLVDFPCLQDGREIYLCWKLGEDQIEHWHEVNTGFSSRKPISTLLKG